MYMVIICHCVWFIPFDGYVCMRERERERERERLLEE